MDEIIFCLVGIFLASNAFAAYPPPVAATYYPIYNNSVGQYVEPRLDMPFNKVSTIFVAFAHVYPSDDNRGAYLDFEVNQPDEVNRLPKLMNTARQVNPKIKILISLGWEHNDWTYISNDYINQANQFVPSVINFIRAHQLDGFDIDDESINGSSGYITQDHFDGVIKNLRAALDQAGNEDHKTYYLSITPAAGIANVDQNNMDYFDLINTQNYGGSDPTDFISQLGYQHPERMTQGIDVDGCDSDIPTSKPYAGLFSWNMTADIRCKYYFTDEIAKKVGYNQ